MDLTWVAAAQFVSGVVFFALRTPLLTASVAGSHGTHHLGGALASRTAFFGLLNKILPIRRTVLII